MPFLGIENDNYIAEKNEILTFRIKNDKIVPAALKCKNILCEMSYVKCLM